MWPYFCLFTDDLNQIHFQQSNTFKLSDYFMLLQKNVTNAKKHFCIVKRDVSCVMITV